MNSYFSKQSIEKSSMNRRILFHTLVDLGLVTGLSLGLSSGCGGYTKPSTDPFGPQPMLTVPGEPPIPIPWGNLPMGFNECPPTTVGDVIDLIDAARVGASGLALNPNPLLLVGARQRVINIALAGSLSHTGFDTIIMNIGFHTTPLGETDSNTATTPKAAVTQWVADPTDQGVLMNGAFHNVGVSCVVDSHGVMWWAAEFGG